MFSSSFVISASRVPETGTVVSTMVSKKPATAASEALLTPETTFGVLSSVHVSFPGSILSGL